MTDFKTLVQMRRSHRKFTSAEIDGDDVKQTALFDAVKTAVVGELG